MSVKCGMNLNPIRGGKCHWTLQINRTILYQASLLFWRIPAIFIFQIQIIIYRWQERYKVGTYERTKGKNDLGWTQPTLEQWGWPTFTDYHMYHVPTFYPGPKYRLKFWPGSTGSSSHNWIGSYKIEYTIIYYQHDNSGHEFNSCCKPEQ